MHGVEERHRARGQLALRMRLTDPREDGEVGHDPEHEERDEPDMKGRGLPVGEERDAKPWNKPEVPESQPATAVAGCGSGSCDRRHGYAATPAVRGTSTTTARSVERRAASASRSSPQPG